MSASSTPTVAPSAASASARFTAVVDLPTPPLPLATATMFFTPGTSFTPRCTACDTIFVVIVTVDAAGARQRGDRVLHELLQRLVLALRRIAEREVDARRSRRRR